MNVLETEWWTVAVPPEWWAESEDESILIGDRDGVGCIQISTLHRASGEFDASEVENIARRESPSAATWQGVSPGDFAGLTGRCAEEGAALREWYVARGGMLLYITYSCDEENRGMDDAAVDEILDTLTVVTG
ncbi:MAG: hypothetical protein U5K56_06620 [Halioglobus sp.]|nr:hypothetical protein [Halioglobus sp.]